MFERNQKQGGVQGRVQPLTVGVLTSQGEVLMSSVMSHGVTPQLHFSESSKRNEVCWTFCMFIRDNTHGKVKGLSGLLAFSPLPIGTLCDITKWQDCNPAHIFKEANELKDELFSDELFSVEFTNIHIQIQENIDDCFISIKQFIKGQRLYFRRLSTRDSAVKLRCFSKSVRRR